MTTKVDNIIKAYAEGKNISAQCEEEGFSKWLCYILDKTLNFGENYIFDGGGKITPQEKVELEEVGFSKEFIRELAGNDGKKALRARVRWLADNIIPEQFLICWKNCNVAERQKKIEKLGSFGSDAKEAVPELMETLKDEYRSIRWGAIKALGNIGPDAKAAVPALLQTAEDEKFAISSEVKKTLNKIGPPEKKDIAALIKALKSQDNDIFFYASSSIILMGPDAKEAVPALIEILSGKNINARASAIWALVNIGPAAFWAIPELQKIAVSDPNPQLREIAEQALEELKKKMR